MKKIENVSFEQLQTLYEVSRKINSQLNFQKLLDEIMDLAVALLRAEKGLILFQNKKSMEMDVKVARAPDKRTIDIHEGIDSTLGILKHLHKDSIEIIKDYGDIPPLFCRASQLNQVFMNVLENAIQAIKDKGTITIKTSLEHNTIFIEISDTGTGISSENLEKIFDPGFTRKGVGVGTGLGLSITYKIVEDQGGTISVDSKLGKGTRFVIKLPLVSFPSEEN